MNKLMEVSVRTVMIISIKLGILKDLRRYHLATNPRVGGIPAKEAIIINCL